MNTRSTAENQSLRLLIALANTALGLALLVALVWAGRQILHAVLIFSLGILVAYALEPLVGRLRALTRGRLSQGSAVSCLLVGIVGALALLVAVAAGPTARQIREVEAQGPALRARAEAVSVGIDHGLAQHRVPFRVATGLQRLSQLGHSRSQALAQEALHTAGVLAGMLVDFALVLVVGIYFLIYSTELKQRLSKHVPALYQQHFQGLRRDMNQILGGFIRGQLVMAAVMGLIVGIGCALLRLPFSILIGLFVAVTSLIPVVGAYLGAVPAVLLAALDPAHPLAKVIWVVLLFVVVNEVGSKILYPRLVGSATGLHEVLVLFVLIAGAEVGGIMGALLAVPVTALVGLAAVYTYRVWQQSNQPKRPEPAPPVISVPDNGHGPLPRLETESAATP
jgi:predicted PurR-regulated permease PerM